METQLVCMVRRCRNLPPHPVTGRRDAFVSMHIAEHFYERIDALDPRRPSVAGGSTGKAGAVPSLPADIAAVAERGSAESGTVHLRVSPLPMDRRRSSSFNPKHEKLLVDPTIPMREVRQRVDDVKLQSRMARDALDPEFYETFVFARLPIPVRRRSSSVLLNCSAVGGGRRVRVGPATASKPVAHSAATAAAPLERSIFSDQGRPGEAVGSLRRVKKIDPTFYLEVEVFDNSLVPGAGERVAVGSVLLDELIEGIRQEVEVPLTLSCDGDGAPKSGAGCPDGSGTAAAAAAGVVELVLEPVNFGVLRPGGSTEDAEPPATTIHRALRVELGDAFSAGFIAKVHTALVAADARSPAGIGSNELVDLLEETYFATGTPVPHDGELRREVEFLFNAFDHDTTESLDIADVCAMLRGSMLAERLKPHWRVPALEEAPPAAAPGGEHGVCAVVNGSPMHRSTAASTKSGGLVAANVAGCLWCTAAGDGTLPEPFTYAGYRKPNGVVHDRTRRPQIPEHAERFVAKDADALYAEVGLLAPLTPPAAPPGDRRRLSGGGGGSGDGDNDDAEEEEEEESAAAAPGPGRSPGLQLPQQQTQKLPSVFGEKLCGVVVEGVELLHCTLDDCVIVRCVLKGGVVAGGSAESCALRDGVDVRATARLRCCRAAHCRVQSSTPVNCFFDRCVLRECSGVMQSSLVACDILHSALSHCRVTRCTLDSRVRDDGANLMEGCEMQSLVFCRDTLDTIEVPPS